MVATAQSITAKALDRNTSQTPGSEHLAATSASTAIATPMWGGMFAVAPGSRAVVHRRGAQETIAYLLGREKDSRSTVVNLLGDHWHALSQSCSPTQVGLVIRADSNQPAIMSDMAAVGTEARRPSGRAHLAQNPRYCSGMDGDDPPGMPGAGNNDTVTYAPDSRSRLKAQHCHVQGGFRPAGRLEVLYGR